MIEVLPPIAQPNLPGGSAVSGGHSQDRAWHSSTAEQSLDLLQVQPLSGLDSREAAHRLERFGPNRLATLDRTSWFRVLGRQFKDILIAILAVAAGVSFAIGEHLDAVAILAILILNGLLGFLQEWRAERSLAALRRMLSLRCRVLRDGVRVQVEAESLVPGDIVLLTAGDRVPADLRLFESNDLGIDESALTGESLAVSKSPAAVEVETPLAERASMAWMGTVVTGGHGHGVVVSTGMQTEFGQVAELTQSVERESTPLQKRLGKLGKQLGLLALSAATLVGVTGWLLGKSALEMFMTSVSLAVAVVPEGLPAVVTVTLAVGVRQMVRRRALPRRLQATETLGSATTILTDKTGTLTENEMTVNRVWLLQGELEVTGTGYTPEGLFLRDGHPFDAEQRPDLLALLQAGLACNHSEIELRDGAWRRVGEPTEAALVVAARKGGLHAFESDPIAELSFDGERKRMTMVFSVDGEHQAFCKGAPEVLLSRCSRIRDGERDREFSEEDLERAADAYQRLARDGMRTLALAQRSVSKESPMTPDSIERELTLLGFVGILDPPRGEVASAVERAMSSGIRVVMITGDAPETACAIAEKIGLPVDRALTGTDLENMEDEELRQVLEQRVLFARATPEHKLRIVRLYKELGEVVGMTGDGVNDAPALKQADIGIAMGIRGTDVAREASDIVLSDDNFASIVSAVEEGRREYDNIRKFVRYLLSSNIGEAVAIFFTIVLRGPLILLPVQILWINVVTDAVTAVSLGLEPAEKDLMRRPPKRSDEPILDRAGMLSILALGTYIGLASLAVFQFYLRAEDLLLAQTMAFTGMVVFEQANLFNHRSLRSPLSSIGYFSNPWLLIALGGTVLLQFAALYVPFMQEALHTTALGWNDWLILIALALPLFLVPETIKRSRQRSARRNPSQSAMP